jgi:S-DNA-T family DNA segregation ATPase FtsK/SpoIIIE
VPYWRFVASRRDHHTDIAAQVEVAKFDAMKAVAKLQIPAQRAAPAIESVPADAELPTVEWPGARTGLTIAEPVPLSDRTAVQLVGGHVLIGGGTDAGKSNLVHLVACTVITRRNALLVGIDMKPGAVELGIYRKAGARIASTKRDAVDLLHWVRDEGIRRGEAMGATIHDEGTLTRSWTATEKDPHLVLVIDELAELVDADPEAAKILKSHTRLLRAMGITVVAATQSPSRHVFGGDSDSRGQYGTRICVATFEPTQTNIILGQGAHGAGWRADQLDGRGSFLIQSRQHRDPQPDRAYWMTDQALADHVNAHATGQPAQHRDAEPEAFARPAASFTPTGSITGDILAYLDDCSAAPREVADAIGGNADSVRARMSQLAAKGELVSDGNGNYKTTKEGKAIAGNVIRFRQHRKT